MSKKYIRWLGKKEVKVTISSFWSPYSIYGIEYILKKNRWQMGSYRSWCGMDVVTSFFRIFNPVKSVFGHY